MQAGGAAVMGLLRTSLRTSLRAAQLATGAALLAGDAAVGTGRTIAGGAASMVSDAACCWVADGFQTTVFPMSAGADGRLPAIAVKLNGVTAYTNPSSGR